MPSHSGRSKLMKYTFFILAFFVATLQGWSQTAVEKAVVERTYRLSQTVFGTKDSLVVEDLFAKKLTYGHSSGKMETREEAIKAITKNPSRYTDTAISNISVITDGDDVAIVRHHFKAAEQKADGTVGSLNLGIMLVWVKEGGKWRLMGRQAYKLN
ncbi:MAG: nuclear transport factor 2 family protein [Chitinophagaceae bacterium]|nr:MAG: nuclear transport factor 2 family protein [Chitinophagaceae bacterium]